MKANELRIGDWVKLAPGAMVQVDSIFKTGIEFNNGFIMLDEVTGIPLTSDLLEKAGFEKENRHKHPMMWAWCIKGIDYIHTVDNCETYFMPFANDEPIYYLHQLQNLYFALTGQELNIDL